MNDLAPAPAFSGPLPRTAMALSERLKLAFPEKLFQHQFVPAKLTAADWKQLTRITPFVGLGWNDIEPNPDAGRLFSGESRWTVFLVTKNAQGIGPRYFGDARAPGLFSMVQAAVALLNGFTIEDVGTAFVTKAGNLYAEGWDTDESAIGGVDVSVGFTLPIGDGVDGIELDDFKTFEITWNFAGANQLVDVVQEGKR